MSAYCVDFNSGSDWYAPASQSDNYWDFSSACPRAWVVIESGQFSSIYQASVSGGSGTPSTSAPVYALSVADGTELAWLIGGAWALAYAARLVIAPIKSALFSPGDDS